MWEVFGSAAVRADTSAWDINIAEVLSPHHWRLEAHWFPHNLYIGDIRMWCWDVLNIRFGESGEGLKPL